MKKTLTLVAIAGLLSFNTYADDSMTSPSITPEQAKAQWTSMTPEQQQAAMNYAQKQAQTKQAAWQSMSPEEQELKKNNAKAVVQPYASQAQNQMQTQMQNRMQSMQGMGGRMMRGH